MSAETDVRWAEANLRYFSACMAVIRARLLASSTRDDDENGGRDSNDLDVAETAARDAREAMPSPAAIDELCSAFGLSPFERDLLLLCAAAELEPGVGALCAAAQRSPERPHATPALAIALLPEAHWTALTPARPLRRWRLVDIVETTRGDAFMTNAIRIDERILHYLTGTAYLDERLQHLMEPIALADRLPRSYLPLADRIVESWSGSSPHWPVVHLAGDAPGGKRTLAAACCRALGLTLHAMRVADLPTAPAELGGFIRLWQREAILTRSALLLESGDADDQAATRHVRTFASRAGGPLFVSGRVQIGRRDARRAETRGAASAGVGTAHALGGRARARGVASERSARRDRRAVPPGRGRD